MLALQGRGRRDRLLDADDALQTLRGHLLLAYDLGMLPEDAFVALTEQVDLVGRQVGGWLKRAGRDG